jgi:hypothetical protein
MTDGATASYVAGQSFINDILVSNVSENVCGEGAKPERGEMIMFRKIAGASRSGPILSATMLAMLTSVGVSRAETPSVAGKTWADPGAIERSKTQGASPDQPAAPPTAPAPAPAPPPAAAVKEPAVKEKTDAASEKEKLKEIIQKSEKSGEKAVADDAHAPEKKSHAAEARETRAPSAPLASRRAHEATRKAHRLVAKHRPPIHYAHDALPSRKEGPAPDMASPTYDPFTGYAQPVRAAY